MPRRLVQSEIVVLRKDYGILSPADTEIGVEIAEALDSNLRKTKAFFHFSPARRISLIRSATCVRVPAGETIRPAGAVCVILKGSIVETRTRKEGTILKERSKTEGQHFCFGRLASTIETVPHWEQQREFKVWQGFISLGRQERRPAC